MVRRMAAVLGATALMTWAANAADAPSAPAQAPDAAAAAAHAVLDKATGQWVLEGVIAGQHTVHDVNAEWVLNGNYVRFTETARERGEDGRPAYEAVVLLGWLKDHYVCFWFDNTEVATGDVTCQAKPAGDSVPLEFRDSKGALIFTNTLAYDRAHDTWEWQMANVQAGKSTPFATLPLHRK